MNIQEKLRNKKEKLKKIQSMLESEIDSQIKYLEYKERQTKLENDIKKLEKQSKNTSKYWIDVGNGWKKRINK